jgi:hypothetical protein
MAISFAPVRTLSLRQHQKVNVIYLRSDVVGVHVVDDFAQLSAALLVDVAGIDPDVCHAPSLCLCADILDVLVTSTIGLRMWLTQPAKGYFSIFLSATGQNGAAWYITVELFEL